MLAYTYIENGKFALDWQLAAWIYEEIFDDDSGDRLRDNTCNYDSSCDYDDYEEDF